MEFRQVRFFVTLAEELHFGRAAAREHIVQSALSQQIKRLENELGTRLLNRSTHHVELTAAGSAFLCEARQLLAHADRAVAAARSAAQSPSILRVGIVDASCDSMPRILREVRQSHPELEVHQVEMSVPDQLRLLAAGQLDVGFGRAVHAPAEVASETFRLDRLGVLLPRGHRLASLAGIPVAMLAGEPLLLSAEARAPEFNQLVLELCRSAGFTPVLYPGSVDSSRAAADLAAHGQCMPCVLASCAPGVATVVWKPLVQPAADYPWSVLWRAADTSSYVQDVVSCARRLADELGWLGPAAMLPGPLGQIGNREAS
ncbi:MAG: LysR family transcriptional regulator [Streptosporangiaceae bacterium]